MPSDIWFNYTRNTRLTGQARYAPCEFPVMGDRWYNRRRVVGVTQGVKLQVQVEFERARTAIEPPADSDAWVKHTVWRDATPLELAVPTLHWLTARQGIN